MAKKRKFKKEVKIFFLVIIFIIVYIVAYKISESLGKVKDEEKRVKVTYNEEKEDTRSLMKQLISKQNVYISNDIAGNIKLNSNHWYEVRLLFEGFSKIRKVSDMTPIYTGYSDDDIRFETDLNVFRIYTVKKEEYYKVPVSSKEEFGNILNESISTSFDFAKQYKKWESVEVSYNDKETKKISKWKFDDLSYKLVSKRPVGKVQPLKSRERSEYNFTIDIKGSNFEIKIETMGEDYVKLSSGDKEGYYEVPNVLYNYLKNDIFKIK